MTISFSLTKAPRAHLYRTCSNNLVQDRRDNTYIIRRGVFCWPFPFVYYTTKSFFNAHPLERQSCIRHNPILKLVTNLKKKMTSIPFATQIAFNRFFSLEITQSQNKKIWKGKTKIQNEVHFVWHFCEGRFTLWPKVERLSTSTNQVARNHEFGLPALHTGGPRPKALTLQMPTWLYMFTKRRTSRRMDKNGNPNYGQTMVCTHTNYYIILDNLNLNVSSMINSRAWPKANARKLHNLAYFVQL